MLNDSERRRIRDAVALAEKGLRAEIVPCVRERSGRYPEAIWAGAACGAALACSALLVLDELRPIWSPLSALLLSIAGAGLAGAGLGRWFGPFSRLLIGRHRLEEAVSLRAKELFFDRRVSDTASRDGVLIFVSLFERRAVVLVDEGVREKVPVGAWRPVIDALTAHASDGRLADALCAAIEKAAEILKKPGLSTP